MVTYDVPCEMAVAKILWYICALVLETVTVHVHLDNGSQRISVTDK